MTTIEPRQIRIAALVLDAKFQFRAAIDPRKVEEYAIAYDLGADFKPVEVAMVNGATVLVDGWHRIAALKKLGRQSVWAKVEEMSEADALWRAAMANLGHGLNLKPAERTQEGHELGHGAVVALVGAGLCPCRLRFLPPVVHKAGERACPARLHGTGPRLFCAWLGRHPIGEAGSIWIGAIVSLGMALQLLRRLDECPIHLFQQPRPAGGIRTQPFPLQRIVHRRPHPDLQPPILAGFRV